MSEEEETVICVQCGCSCSQTCSNCNGCATCCNNNPTCNPCCDAGINTMTPVIYTGSPTPAGAAESGTTLPDCCCTNTHGLLANDFVVPIEGGNVTIEVCDEDNYYVGQEIYVRGAGRFPVVSAPSDTTLELTNDGRVGNASPGTIVPAGEPFQGVPPISADVSLPLINDFFCADWEVPLVGATALACISNVEAWACPGQYIYVPGHGYFQVASISDENHAQLLNEGWIGNSVPGTTITQATCVISSPDPNPNLDPNAPPEDPISFLITGLTASSPGLAVTTIGSAYGFNSNSLARPPLFAAPDIRPDPCPLTLVQHDNRAGADLPNNRWVVPEDGIYFLTGMIEVGEGSLAGGYLARFGVINTDEGLHFAGHNTAFLPTALVTDDLVSVTTLIRLYAGEQVGVFMGYFGAGGVTQIRATAGTPCRVENVTFLGHKVGP